MLYSNYNTVIMIYEVWRGNAPLKRIEAYSGGSISQQSDSNLKTSFRGTFFKYTGVNFLTDRLQVHIEINDVIYPLGTFCVTTETPKLENGIELIDIEAYSLLWLIQRAKLETRKYYAAGTRYAEIIQGLIAETGITNYNVEASDLTLATAREDWDIGTDYLKIINELLAEMNYNSLWVTNLGEVRATKYTAPSMDNITQRYTSGKDSIIKDEYTITTDYYDKANVFIAICDNPELETTLRAESVNDDANSPYSTVNIGQRIPKIVYVANTPSEDELQNYADNLKAKSHQTNEIIEFVTAINPTHSMYDTVLLNVGDAAGVYREIGYEITLSGNYEMKHTGARVIV